LEFLGTREGDYRSSKIGRNVFLKFTPTEEAEIAEPSQQTTDTQSRPA